MRVLPLPMMMIVATAALKIIQRAIRVEGNGASGVRARCAKSRGVEGVCEVRAGDKFDRLQGVGTCYVVFVVSVLCDGADRELHGNRAACTGVVGTVKPKSAYQTGHFRR